eukprot:Colp12_sorted_trinity150504_noHs@9281
MLLCAGDKIFANDVSVIGSIGVVSQQFAFVKVLEKLGVEYRKHTAGDHKGRFDPYEPENPDDVVKLKSMQKETHEFFKDVVRSSRGANLIKDRDHELYSGDFWLGKTAAEMGLVDGCKSLVSHNLTQCSGLHAIGHHHKRTAAHICGLNQCGYSLRKYSSSQSCCWHVHTRI